MFDLKGGDCKEYAMLRTVLIKIVYGTPCDINNDERIPKFVYNYGFKKSVSITLAQKCIYNIRQER